jgi:rhodanese-related sulfurtransferase
MRRVTIEVERLDPIAASAPREDRAVLDVRELAAFAAGHLPGSGHLPAAELAERRAELPPRGTPVLVVADEGSAARTAAETLIALGYPRVAALDAPLSEWPGGAIDRAPARRLWRPSPFLERMMPYLPRPGPGVRVIDLAAGAGREAVFLALAGYQVDAWDHDGDVLLRANALAERHGVAITTVVRNLERRVPDLPVGEHQVVTVFRFLHRPLLPHIARAVAPGGCLVYETFRRGQERFGRPKSGRFLFDPGELRGAFPDLEVEHYEESDPPEGPVLARLLARRRP